VLPSLRVFFWDVLGEIAAPDGMTLNELIARLYDEVIEAEHGIDNFASFLRVCCGRYLRLQADRMIPGDRTIQIRSLDAENVLSRRRSEYAAMERRKAERDVVTAS
jgi:predicted DNA-binding ribbon-helix-helix protein